ncbi:MAG: RNA polymerase factor sigma-32 [Alphaproteobacteria bacterium]|nr:RNA polymerase factor sigma-32 [Alphaproteobacteria bacterium]
MSQNSHAVIVKNTTNLPLVVEENSLFSYLEKIKKFPILSEEEEIRLVEEFRRHGSLEAAQTLVTSHLRLAAKIALTYRRYGLPLADIISEANIGLMQAVKKFDLEKKVRLATYAIWWIKAAVNDYVLRSWSLVKIGTVAAQKKLFYNLSRIKSRLGLYDNKAMEPEVVEQIAKELVVDKQDVIEMDQRLGGDSSLNVVAGDDGTMEKIDFLVDKRQNIEENASRKQENSLKQKILYQCLSLLNEREQYIIKNRMLSDAPVTLEEIGEKFAISRERVRQIEKKAFDKLSEKVKLALASEMC